MKKKLIFIIPALALLGFLLIKPPAVGSEQKQVVVTPTSTTTATPVAKPNLRDFDNDGNGPDHHDDMDDHHGLFGDDHHDGLHDGHDDDHHDDDLREGDDD